MLKHPLLHSALNSQIRVAVSTLIRIRTEGSNVTELLGRLEPWPHDLHFSIHVHAPRSLIVPPDRVPLTMDAGKSEASTKLSIIPLDKEPVTVTVDYILGKGRFARRKLSTPQPF